VEYEKDGEVLVLDGGNIQTALGDYKLVVVEFYAPWCGHCNALKPEYEKAAYQLQGETLPVKAAFGKMDCTEDGNKKTCEAYKVTGYPTVKLFQDAKLRDDVAARKADELLKFMQVAAEPRVKVITTLEQAEAVSKKDLAFVIFVKDITDAASDIAETVAETYDGVSYGVTDSVAIAKAFKIKKRPSALFYVKHADKPLIYRGFPKSTSRALAVDLGSDKLRKFIKKHYLPLVPEFTDETADAIFDSPKRSHLIVFADKGTAQWKVVREFVEASAAKNEKKWMHVMMHTKDPTPRTKDTMAFFGMSDASDVPTAAIADMEPAFKADRGNAMEKYAFPTGVDFTAETLAEWVQAFDHGELKSKMRGQMLPKDDEQGGVKTVVADNFNDVVMSNTDDVFIEFYAPWCGHCKTLAPIWEQVGRAYGGTDGIRVAKFDWTANDMPHLNIHVKTFPTILHVKGGAYADKTVEPDTMPKTVDREFKALAEWILESAVNKVQKPAALWALDGSSKKKRKKYEL
jgi:protein disulfide isomerase